MPMHGGGTPAAVGARPRLVKCSLFKLGKCYFLQLERNGIVLRCCWRFPFPDENPSVPQPPLLVTSSSLFDRATTNPSSLE